METYLFLPRDLDVLKRRLAYYDEEWRATVGSVHDATTQSSETWHDNPQFDDVQQRARMLEVERRKLSAILKSSVLVEPSAPDGRVDVGSTVRLHDLGSGTEDRLTIGSYMVLDADDDRISYASPLARLLLGHTTGDTVTGTIGPRKVELEIIDVGVSHEDALTP